MKVYELPVTYNENLNQLTIHGSKESITIDRELFAENIKIRNLVLIESRGMQKTIAAFTYDELVKMKELN